MKKHEVEKTPNSVASMSPEYPRHRDALIFGIVVFILLGVLVGGYFFVRGVDSTFREFTQKPLSLLESLTDRHVVYETCESFLRRNKEAFRELGPGIRFSLIEDKIDVFGKEKTMTLVFNAQGMMETREVIFHLKKEGREWVVQYVGFERRNGQYETLFFK